MKKCHSCGTSLENSEKTIQEFDDEYYCIFCIDQDGKPRKPNPVRESILKFWRARVSKDQDSKHLRN